MKTKIMLLALAAISSSLFALPSVASATLAQLHMSPVPTKLDIAGVGKASLRSSAGTITCNGVTGSATPENSTTGTMTLRFGGDCTNEIGLSCTGTNPVEEKNFITTTALPYHLVTIDSPTTPAPAGVLVTPANGAFAHFICGPVGITVKGNGVLGTITSPECGGTSSTATISFKASGGTTAQQHRFTHAPDNEPTKTTGPWELTVGEKAASQEAHATLTATNAAGAVTNTTLTCT